MKNNIVMNIIRNVALIETITYSPRGRVTGEGRPWPPLFQNFGFMF